MFDLVIAACVVALHGFAMYRLGYNHGHSNGYDKALKWVLAELKYQNNTQLPASDASSDIPHSQR